MSPALLAATSASLLATGVGAGTAAWATLSAGSQLCGPVLVAPRRPGEILLTFDDGPNPAATPHLLEVLNRHGVLATFFLIGGFARREPGLVREIAARGHAVGNHTETHPWLHLQSSHRIRQELSECNAVLEDILGAPVTLFRPPHGARRPAVLRIARSLGMAAINWNIIVQDWKPTPAEVLLGRLNAGLRRTQRKGRGANMVLHDGGHTGLGQPRTETVRAVDLLLTELDQRPQPPEFVLPGRWLKAADWTRFPPGGAMQRRENADSFRER